MGGLRGAESRYRGALCDRGNLSTEALQRPDPCSGVDLPVCVLGGPSVGPSHPRDTSSHTHSPHPSCLQGLPVLRSPSSRPALAMLRLLPWLRALTRESAQPPVRRGLAAGERSGAGMFPTCYCAGRAKQRAVLLPLEPYGHGLLHALPPDACRTRGHGKRKSWNFIHEKMSYDTFFTMKRLIERSRSVGEVLRWVTQNPGKVSASHYPIALHKLGQLLQQQGQAAVNGESRGPGPMLEQPEFQTLCQAIISGCAKFDNFSIVNCLYAAAALGECSGLPVTGRALGRQQGGGTRAGVRVCEVKEELPGSAAAGGGSTHWHRSWCLGLCVVFGVMVALWQRELEEEAVLLRWAAGREADNSPHQCSSARGWWPKGWPRQWPALLGRMGHKLLLGFIPGSQQMPEHQELRRDTRCQLSPL